MRLHLFPSRTRKARTVEQFEGTKVPNESSPLGGIKPEVEMYNGYCLKCRQKQDFAGTVVVTNFSRMAKGPCSVCGTTINRMLKKVSNES
jgi:hypothetical protein